MGAGAGSFLKRGDFRRELLSRYERRSPHTLTRRTPPASTCSTSVLLRRTCFGCCRRLAHDCQKYPGRNTGRRMPSRRRQLRLQAVLLPRHRQLLLGRIQDNPFKAPTKEAEDVALGNKRRLRQVGAVSHSLLRRFSPTPLVGSVICGELRCQRLFLHPYRRLILFAS